MHQHGLCLRLLSCFTGLLGAPFSLGLLLCPLGSHSVALCLLISGTLLERSQASRLLLFLDADSLLFTLVCGFSFLKGGIQ